MKTKTTWHWFEIGLIVVYIFAHIVAAFSPVNSVLNWYSSDDAFYYYKVAENITTGHGVTFDGVNPTNGFHPLWMLVCIPVFSLARFDLILPLRVLVGISALFNLGTTILLFRLLRRFINSLIAAVAAIFWAFFPPIHAAIVQGGVESSISAFFVSLLLFLAVKWRSEQLSGRRLTILGIVAGLAVLARLDNIFVVMLLGVWFALGFSGVYLRTIVVGDLALIFLTGLLSYYIRLRNGPFYASNTDSLVWLIGLGFIIKPLSYFFFDLYKPLEKPLWRVAKRILLAISVASFSIGILLLFFRWLKIFETLPLSVVLIDGLGSLLGIFFLRLLAGTLSQKDEGHSDFSFYAWTFWREPVRRSFVYYLPVATLLGIYLVFNHFCIGSLMPVSGEIKHWWGTLPNPVYGIVTKTIPDLFGLSAKSNAWSIFTIPMQWMSATFGTGSGSPYALFSQYFVIAAFTIITIFSAISERLWFAGILDQLGLFVLLAALYSQIINYTSTTYLSMRHWYWVGEMLFGVICLAIFSEMIYRSLSKLRIVRVTWQGILTIVGAGCIVLFWKMMLQEFSYAPSNTVSAYIAEARAIESYTEPGALIGMPGGGSAAYFITDRTIVNLDGLINSPEYFSALQQGQGAVFLSHMELDYVYGRNYVITESDPYKGIFIGHLEPITYLGDWILARYVP